MKDADIYSCHCVRSSKVERQQDSVPIHCVHQTVELLRHESPKLIGPVVQANDLQVALILVPLNSE